MRAWVLDRSRTPLREDERPTPHPGPHQVLIEIEACAICRTDLHIIDGDLPLKHPRLVLGHEIVGVVRTLGSNVATLETGQRVGIPWLGETCGECDYCLSSRENLCDAARFTGYDVDGGFAEYTLANARFCFPISRDYPPEQAAPLLCAGLIGYRSLMMTGSAKRLGFFGFGAAAHIMAQVAHAQGREVYALTRPGDVQKQKLAKDLHAVWAGGSDEELPVPLDAVIIFAAAGELIPKALSAVIKGGTVVCAGIHMTDIPSFPYNILWGERILRSVANLTRRDGEEFLDLAPQISVRTITRRFPLSQVNDAIARVRGGKIDGAAVVIPDSKFIA
ncbi:MAG: zinc-dependent alcohol dehydrogenase family protein [Planctomycetaceae bacterium]